MTAGPVERRASLKATAASDDASIVYEDTARRIILCEFCTNGCALTCSYVNTFANFGNSFH